MEIQIQEGGRRPDEVNREPRQTRELFSLSAANGERAWGEVSKFKKL
jgi:hypothetical protein